jgi:hypothetical protein
VKVRATQEAVNNGTMSVIHVAVHERLTIASTTQTHVQSLRTRAAAAVEFAQRRRKRSLKIESASLCGIMHRD